MVAWRPGGVVLVKYEDPEPLWHQRLLCGLIEAATWVVCTPDGDFYPEDLQLANPEIRAYRTYLPGGVLPDGVPAGNVYGFPQRTERDFWILMSTGFQLAFTERQRLGHPPAVSSPDQRGSIRPNVPAIPASSAVVGFLQDFPLGDLHVARPFPGLPPPRAPPEGPLTAVLVHHLRLPPHLMSIAPPSPHSAGSAPNLDDVASPVTDVGAGWDLLEDEPASQ